MINYREIIKDEEIKLQNLYLEVMLGIIDPDERINILDI